MHDLTNFYEAVTTLRQSYFLADYPNDLRNVKSDILTQITEQSYQTGRLPSEFEVKFDVPYDCRLICETVAELFSLLSIENYNADCVQNYPSCSVRFQLC